MGREREGGREGGRGRERTRPNIASILRMGHAIRVIDATSESLVAFLSR